MTVIDYIFAARSLLPRGIRFRTAAFFIMSITLICGGLTAQQADTLTVSLPDTVAEEADVDSILSGCDRREYLVSDNATILYGTDTEPAWFTYLDMKLDAFKITIYGNDSLIAEGKQVPANPDSFPGGFKYVGLPVLNKSGDEPLTGKKMVYNLRTEKGAVEEGRTKFEGGYYFGENFTRLDDEFIQIKDGYFTTCDLEEEPHFHFRSSQMKMKVKDKIVAKPVVFYIEDIPIFMLPFGMFPIRSGRSSGFILPSYGESSTEGRYLRGMGYYFAPNDYIDSKVLMDYFDKSGVFVRGDLQYALRYKLRGSISGSITRKNFADQGVRRWDLRISHSQTIDPTLSVSVSGNFQSDNSFYKNFSLDRDQRAQRRIYSSAQINKKWENSPNSLSIQMNRTEDLELGSVTEMLPSITFSRNTPTYLFRKAGASGSTASGDEPFYSTFNFTYNSRMQNQRSKTRSDPDSAFTKDVRSGMQHNLSFSSPQRLFKYLAVNPSLQYREDWFNEAEKKTLGPDNKIVTEKEKGFFTRRTFNTSVSANTKVYGMFNLNIGSLKTVRHVFTPTVSLSYTPDFSDPRYGYYDTVTDSLGNEIEYDRFRGSLYGGTPSSMAKMVSFSLNNLFQARTVSGENENKFDFFSINTSTSYNLAALPLSQKWSSISSSFRIMKLFDLTLRTTHSLYKYNTDPTKAPEFLYDSSAPLNKRRFIRLTNFSTSSSFNFSGKGTGDSEKEEQEEDVFSEELTEIPQQRIDPQDRFEGDNDLAQQEIPWELRTSFSFSYNKFDPSHPNKMLTANADFNIQVTKNWRMSYRGNFDLVKREITYQDFSFYRDLHCWELSFNWTPPSSSRAGFFFELRIKDPKLRDIKVRRTDYGGSAIGFIR